MSFNYDRLYVLKDDDDKSTTRVLSFLNDCVIDINQLAKCKIYILPLDRCKFKDPEVVAAMNARGIKALPALEIRSIPKVIEGAQNIINYYHQLTSNTNVQQQHQQLRNPMMEEPEDPYRQYYANDMYGSGNDAGEDGKIGEDFNDTNAIMASRSSRSNRLASSMDEIAHNSTPNIMNQDKVPREMPSIALDEQVGKVKLDYTHAPKKDIKAEDADLDAALMDKLGNTGDM